MNMTARVLAAAVLVLVSPLLLILALAVWADCGRSVFYRETRLGAGGRTFCIYKFRTLRDPNGPLIAPVNDVRITRTGRWLRRFRLDELPQLFNILRGEMTFVGPRPARPEVWQGVPARLRDRALEFRPGLTSPAALCFLCEDAVLAEEPDAEGAYRTVLFPARVAQDVAYFEHRSAWRDLLVVLRTPLALMRLVDDSACRERIRGLLHRPQARREDLTAHRTRAESS